MIKKLLLHITWVISAGWCAECWLGGGLTTDASNGATGAVLSQGPIGKDLPIVYASRTLKNAERNYPTVEKELLATVWGCKYFRQYLYGRKFTIVTSPHPYLDIQCQRTEFQTLEMATDT
jgi:hypothetical protein